MARLFRWALFALAAVASGCANDDPQACADPGAACFENDCQDGTDAPCDALESTSAELGLREHDAHGSGPLKLPFVPILAIYDPRPGKVVASSDDPGAHCRGGLCLVRPGATVTLRASPNTGVDFLRWTGCSDASGAPASWPVLTLTDVQTLRICKAEFAVAIGGSAVTIGSGDISLLNISPDRGFRICLPNNACLVPYGATVTVSVQSDDGYLVRWSGCTTAVGPTIVLEHVTSTQQCFARKDPASQISWSVSPQGGGSVQPGPLESAETCGTSSCQVGRYRTFSLTALPAPGHRFDRWSGCSDSTSPTVDLFGRAATHCEAIFAPLAPAPSESSQERL